MNKKIVVGIGIVIIITGILFLSGVSSKKATPKIVRLGYCPTMKPIAEKIAENNENIVLVKQPNSAQTLQALSVNIDIALIGRMAKGREIQSTNRKMLGKGYTLVTDVKRFVQENELSEIKIHTAIEENIAKQMLPNSELIFYKTTQEAISQGLGETVLIDWNDYEDEYELLVVMKGMKKVEKFRIPVLYSENYNLEELRVEFFK